MWSLMADRFNISSWFILICLAEEDGNGDALYCHRSKTEHYRLETKEERVWKIVWKEVLTLGTAAATTAIITIQIKFLWSNLSQIPFLCIMFDNYWFIWNYVNFIMSSGLLRSGHQARHFHPAPVCREDCALPCNPINIIPLLSYYCH